MGLSPLRGSLRAAPRKGRKYHCTQLLHHRKQPSPHDLRSKSGCLASLLIARSCMGGHGGRRQVASRKEERSAALTIQFSRNREGGCYLPLHFTTDIFLLIGGVCSKNFFEFFPHGCNSLNNRLVVNPFLPCILTNTYSTEHDNIEYFKLNGTK